MIRCARYLHPLGEAHRTVSFPFTISQTAPPMREVGACKPGEMVGGASAHWGGNARRLLTHV